MTCRSRLGVYLATAFLALPAEHHRDAKHARYIAAFPIDAADFADLEVYNRCPDRRAPSLSLYTSSGSLFLQRDLVLDSNEKWVRRLDTQGDAPQFVWGLLEYSGPHVCTTVTVVMNRFNGSTIASAPQKITDMRRALQHKGIIVSWDRKNTGESLTVTNTLDQPGYFLACNDIVDSMVTVTGFCSDWRRLDLRSHQLLLLTLPDTRDHYFLKLITPGLVAGGLDVVDGTVKTFAVDSEILFGPALHE